MGRLLENEQQRNEPVDELLTVSQVAKLLNASPSTVRRWANLGLLHPLWIGLPKQRRFHRIDVERFLARNKGRGEIKVAPGTTSSNIWDSPRIIAILERPKGTPIDLSELTKAERDAILEDAKGIWADHPDIKDSVTWVRELREGLSDRF